MMKEIRKYEKCSDGSYLHNCYISPREEDKEKALFSQGRESITAHLNGYAVIPMEEYARLTNRDFSKDFRWQISAAKEADKQLSGEASP